MAAVFRRKGCARYRVRYKDERGASREVAGHRTRKASEDLARRLEGEAEARRRARERGEPAEEPAKPFAEAVEAFAAEVRRLGNSEGHVKEVRRRLAVIGEACRWRRLGDVGAAGLTAYLAKITDAGRAPSTVNKYRHYVSSLLAFCARQGWRADNPVAKVRTAKAAAGGGRRRRAFADAEVAALLAAADETPHGDYVRLALLSGFRVRECTLLEARDVDWGGARPLWRPRAEVVKGRRREAVPVLPEAVPLVRRLCEGKGPCGRLLGAKPPTRKVFRSLLKKAGVAEADAEGRHVDRHALRYTFCRMLGRRLPIQTVKVLMRHKDIRMTCNLYMALGLEDVGEELLKLPTSILPAPQPKGGTA
jgi:integrase